MSGVEKTAEGPRIGEQVTDAPVVIARSEGDEAIPVRNSAATDTYAGPNEGTPTAIVILPDGNLNAKIRAVLPEAFPSRVRKAIYDELAGLSSEDLTKEFYPILLRHALDHWLGAGDLYATFPEDIRQALVAKLTLAAREHNRNLILEVLVPMLAGWQMEAIKRFLADPKQLVGLLTWQIPPAVKTRFQIVQALPASVILHPTIRGGEFDPAHIAPADKDLAELTIDRLLVAEHLYADAVDGIPMQRNDMLGEAYFRDGSGAPRSALDAGIYLAQTEFARVSGLWAYLRDELLPLFAGRNDVVAASFGPGFSVMQFDDTLPRFTTYEPYLLAAYLPATSRVHVYDWAPEVSLATQQFKGRMAIATIWHYVEKETLSPAEEAFLLGRLGPSFRVMLKNSKAFFERFIAEKGVRIVSKVTDKNFEGVDGTVYILEWPEELYRSVIPSPQPRNFIFDVYEPEALDLAFFQLGGTDYICGDDAHDYSLSVATLIRIVHQLKPGGYLVTDPYVTDAPSGRRLLRYSPDPGMMQALGLEAVFDLRATTAPATNKRGIVFRKVGSSNHFVLRMIERIEGAYARARAELTRTELQVTDHEIQTVLKYVSEHPPFTVNRRDVWTRGSSMVLQGDLTEAIAFHRSTHLVIELDVEDQADAFVHLVNEITPRPSPVFGFIVLRASGKPVGYRSFILDASNSETVSLTMQMVYVVPASRGHGYTDWIDQTLVAATLYAYRSSHNDLTLTFSDVRNKNHVRRYAAAGMEEVVTEFDIDDADDDTPLPFAAYSPVVLVRAAALGLGSSFRTTLSMGTLKDRLAAPVLPPEKPADSRTTNAVPLVVANWSDFFAMYRRLPRHQQIIKHEGEDIMIDADHPEVLGQLLVKNARVRKQFETVLGFLEKDANALQMERCSTFRKALALLQDGSGKYAVEWDRLVMKVFEHKTVVPVTMDHGLLSTVDSLPSTDGEVVVAGGEVVGGGVVVNHEPLSTVDSQPSMDGEDQEPPSTVDEPLSTAVEGESGLSATNLVAPVVARPVGVMKIVKK